MSFPAESSRTLVLHGEPETAALAHELSLFLKAGDVIALRGDLGAGKTAFARALINALATEGDALDVPSPTFTLVQQYDQTRVPVAHFDFYRVREAEEVEELGFPALAAEAALLVEWPENAADYLPANRLEIAIGDGPDEESRTVTLAPLGAWAPRLVRMLAIAEFLATSGYGDHRRTFLQGDASARRYERLTAPDAPDVIFMDSPEMPDGPAVRHGLPYSQIAHIAEDVRAFVGVDQELRRAGLSAPAIHAADLDRGLLVIEDLGGEVLQDMVREAHPGVNLAYEAAVDVLCKIASGSWPEQVSLHDGSLHHVPPYDPGALEIEAELLLDWYWPALKGEPCPQETRDAFLDIWRALWPRLNRHKSVWCLRDYHSPNLIWRGEMTGLARMGVIDFQDAVLGHPAYDLASLLQDARVDVSPEIEDGMLKRYLAIRSGNDAGFDAAGFLECYAILGAQRLTKILGIFVRLKERDGKPHYLQHVPRLWRYLERTLEAPVLSDLKHWYEVHLPEQYREVTVSGGTA